MDKINEVYQMAEQYLKSDEAKFISKLSNQDNKKKEPNVENIHNQVVSRVLMNK